MLAHQCKQCGKFKPKGYFDLGLCDACLRIKHFQFLQTMNFVKLSVNASIYRVMQELFTEDSSLEKWTRNAEASILYS